MADPARQRDNGRGEQALGRGGVGAWVSGVEERVFRQRGVHISATGASAVCSQIGATTSTPIVFPATSSWIVSVNCHFS